MNHAMIDFPGERRQPCVLFLLLALFALLFCVSPPSVHAGPWDALRELYGSEDDTDELRVSRSALQKVIEDPRLQYSPLHMASRLKRLYGIRYGWPLVRQIQQELLKMGYEIGKADGILGQKTRFAIFCYQGSRGLRTDGLPSDELLRSMQKHPVDGSSALLESAVDEQSINGVYDLLLQRRTIDGARVFYYRHKHFLDKLSRVYQVPQTLIVGMYQINEYFISFLGDDNALNLWASMAATSSFAQVEPYFPVKNLSHEQRAYLQKAIDTLRKIAYKQVKAIILYSNKRGSNPFSLSCYQFTTFNKLHYSPPIGHGAVGQSLFVPTTLLKYAEEKRRLPGEPATLSGVREVLAKLAYYLAANESLDKKNSPRFLIPIAQFYKSGVAGKTALEISKRLEHSPPPARARVQLHKAVATMEAADFDRANEIVNSVLSSFSNKSSLASGERKDYAEALYLKAYLLFAQGKKDASRKTLRQAQAVAPAYTPVYISPKHPALQ